MTVLGFDFSGVFVPRQDKNGGQLCESDNPWFPGALPGFTFLLKRYGAHNVYIISRCKDASIEYALRYWLRHRIGFYQGTGFLERNLCICLERSNKPTLCRSLGIDTFVDDRLEVLGQLQGIVRRRILFQPRDKEVCRQSADYQEMLRAGQIKIVQSWDELSELLVPEGRYEYSLT